MTHVGRCGGNFRKATRTDGLHGVKRGSGVVATRHFRFHIGPLWSLDVFALSNVGNKRMGSRRSAPLKSAGVFLNSFRNPTATRSTTSTEPHLQPLWRPFIDHRGGRKQQKQQRLSATCLLSRGHRQTDPLAYSEIDHVLEGTSLASNGVPGNRYPTT